VTRVLLPILLAGTVLATWLAYLLGYSAGQREQVRQTLRDIEALRRAEASYDPDYMCPNCVTPWKCNGPHISEDDRVQVDPRTAALAAADARWLAKVVDS
jgi:hypothetical protein